MTTYRVVIHSYLTLKNSVKGYFIVSVDLFALIQHDCRLHVMERIESDHLPLELHTNVEEIIGATAEEDTK